MKNIFQIIVGLIIIIGLNYSANAQTINVCGTDTIILTLNNYQQGVIQWQESADSVNWVNIDGANDSVYKFFPTEEKYYRAMNTFSSCPPEYSQISFIQLPPVANAGTDRRVPTNSIVMKGNSMTGCLGTWTVIQGSGGSFSNPNFEKAQFSGSDTLYTLEWKLTNACGTDRDSIKIEFVQNEYYEDIAIVDTTDNIISDSLQQASGLFIIEFGPFAPTISDSTILMGIVDYPFLRKVDSFLVVNDTFYIHTSQASLQDITKKGAYDIGHSLELDSVQTKSSHGYMRLNERPTRAKLTQEAKFKSGNYYYLISEEVKYILPGVTINKPKGSNSLIDLSFSSTLYSNNNFSLNLDGSYSFDPNIIADVDYGVSWCGPWYFKYPCPKLYSFKAGMYNGEVKRNYKLSLNATKSVTLAAKEFSIFEKTKRSIFVIGGVPVYVETILDIGGELTANVSGNMNISHEYTKTSLYTAAIEYNHNNGWSYPFSKSSSVTVDDNLNITGSFNQGFEIGPSVSFMIYGIVGPYVGAYLTEDFEACVSSQQNWKAELNIGGKLTVGAKAEICGVDIFDLDKSWTQGFYNFTIPYRMDKISGYNQQFNSGNPLLSPTKVRVISSSGFPVPGVLLRFNPETGGSVQNQTAYTNIHGEAETVWTPGNNGSNPSSLKVSFENCNNNEFSGSYKYFNAIPNSSGVNCTQSSLAAIINHSGNYIQPKAFMGVPPYSYSTDGLNYSSTIPQVNPVAGNTYNFYVKDNQACIAFANYTEPQNPCNNTNLSVSATILSNGIQASASGGNPPYQYSLDNASSGFSSNNTFSNISPGSHAVYVKDANGCVKYQGVYINSSIPPVIAAFSINKVFQNVGSPVQFTNLSNNGSTYLWDFGDNNNSTMEHPSHSYSSPGSYNISLTASNPMGSNTKTLNSAVSIGYAPSTDFSSNLTTVAVGQNITFSDNSNNSPTEWYWDFGDGNTSTSQNPIHAYNSVGQYTVSLGTKNNYGSDTLIKTNFIDVGNSPVADFSSNTQITATDSLISFTDASTNNPTSWLWNFGDGNTSTLQNPTHTYSFAGDYTVSLTATNSYGNDTETKTNYIDVGNIPIADFTVSSASPTVGQSVIFTDQSSASPSSWLWDFGDGNSSTSQNPSHTYISAGTYTVTLTVTNTYGSNTETKSSYIVSDYPPTADFSSNTQIIATDSLLSFTDASTNNPTSWLWNFGDGNTSNLQNPTHTYSFAGDYTVSLTATNSYGNDTETKTNYIDVGNIPIADFTVSSASPTVGQSVIFTDQSSASPNSWLWDFGDGNSSTSQNPSHTYISAGTYTVTLTVTNTYGSNTETKSSYIVSDYPPTADFSSNTQITATDSLISFTDASTNNPTSWLWNFGDGNTSNLQNPTHTYSFAGDYTVSLTATNSYGNDTETKTNYIDVGNIPIADFTVSSASPTVGQSVIFTDQSSASPSSWLWDFGDGNSSTSQNPSHTYISAGTYTVTLTVTNTYGSDSLVRNAYIVVSSPINADFTINPTTIIISQLVTFTDQSTGSPDSWKWYFGDGDSSLLQNPTHTYLNAGSYEVKLIVSGANTTDTATANIDVYNTDYGLIAYFPFNGNAADSSGNGHISTLHGAILTTDTIGNSDNAYEFDGLNDYIDLGTTSALKPVNSVTISAWAKADDWTPTVYNPIYSNTEAGGFSLALYPTELRFYCRANGAYLLPKIDNSTLSKGWHFIAGVFDGRYAKLYIDGVCVDTVDAGAVYPIQNNSTTLSLIGAEPYSSGNLAGQYFDGKIDEVRLYGRAVSDYEIQSLYNSTYSQIAPLAGFINSMDTVFVGDTLQLTDTSTNNPASWSWDFGDGNSSSLQNPQHIYTAPGVYTITLITSNSGGSDTISSQLRVYSLNQGLVAYYPFSGNANDSTGNGHNGTALNGALLSTDRLGNPNSAYSFDGVDDYIKIPDHDSLDLTNNMTISTWIKVDSFNYLAGIVSKYHVSQANGYTLRLAYDSPYRGLNCNDKRTDDTILQVNTWYHVVGVVDNNNVNIYVNGNLISTHHSVAPAQVNNNFVAIGMDYNFSPRYFKGIIDEVRLYNRPLADIEIQELYNTTYLQIPPVSGFSVSQDTLFVGDTLKLTDTSINNPTSWNWDFGDGNTSNIQNPEHIYTAPGDYTITLIASNSSSSDTFSSDINVYSLNQSLLAYYPFSGNANDSSGNSQHLTVNGATLTTDKFGSTNSAYSFDGVDDYLKNASPNFAMGEDSSFTVSLWVNSSGTGRYFWHGLLLSQGGSGKFTYMMSATSTQNTQLGFVKQGSAWTWTNYPNSYNTWEHWVFIYDNGQISLYKNGVNVVNNIFTKSGAQTATMPFYIGCESGVGGYLTGKIDEVRLYSRPLNATEIQRLYSDTY